MKLTQWVSVSCMCSSTFNFSSSFLTPLTVASSDKHNCTALGLARIEGHKNMEKMLVEYGCSLGSEEQQFSLLLRACELGKLDMVKELVEVHNVNPSSKFILSCD